MTQIELTENQIELVENRIAALRAQIAELRAQQANISQKTESQKTESQETVELTEELKTAQTVELTEELKTATTAKDLEQLARQQTDNIQKPDTSQKKKPGESRASHAPLLPRIRIKICKEGDGGDHHRGTIEKEDLPPFKEEHQVKIADDLDSGQGPPSSRKEPAMCGLLTMRGLLAAEHPFTVDDYNALDNNDCNQEEPFTAHGLDSGQGPPSSKEEQQGGTSRDIGDIDSTTETESGATGMPATEEPCAPALASGSSDYDFGYNFNISDMGTIMKDKDKGLRLALGG